MNYIVGMKYQIYDGDELKVYRLKKVKNEATVVLTDVKTKQDIIVPGSTLSERYVALDNDAFLNCMIAPAEDGIPDVYVCVNHCSSLAGGNNEPSVVLRQNIYSASKNPFNLSGEIYVGECVSINTLGNNEKITDFFEFTEITESASVAVYIDDTIQDMVDLIPNKFMKDVNTTLMNLKNMDKSGTIQGYCETLYDLMLDNHFMRHYLASFNVLKIDFPIVLGDESYDKEGDIKLNKKQINLLEKAFDRYISDVKVIKYDRDFDVSQIVNTTHSMVCDSDNIIYLIAYTVDGYIGDDDVTAAMHANANV